MAHTINTIKTKIIRGLEQLAASFGETGPQPVAEATQSLLTAYHYGDKILTESALEAVWDACRGQVIDIVENWLNTTGELKARVQALLSRFEERPIEPGERLDKLGEALQESHRFATEGLRGILANPGEDIMKRLGVDLVDPVHAEIRFWDDFKANVLDTWPWSNRAPLPVDREMVLSSRAAFERGEGIPIQELIQSLGGK